MKRLSLVLTATLGMTACGTSMNEVPTRAADEVTGGVSTTWHKLREYTATDGKKPATPLPTSQARYCYKSLQDIICYHKPIPGQEDRLVAWQGLHGETGYIIEPGDDRSSAPVSLPPLKSETVAPAPTVKGGTSGPKEIIFDPAELMPKELVPQKSE